MTSQDETDVPQVDPTPVDASEHEEATDGVDSKPVTSSVPTSPSDSRSTTPASPSQFNPLTPGRQPSPGFDVNAIILAMDRYNSLEEEFPNPYEDFPPMPYSTHDRIHSLPDLSVFQLPDPQPPQRTPSILRPSHPKFLNSVGSRRASLALPGIEFGTSPLALGDRRLSMHYSPAFHLGDGEGVPLRPHSAMPWQPQRSSLAVTQVATPSPTDDYYDEQPQFEEYSAEEPHIEVSERFEQYQSELDGRPVYVQPEAPQLTRQPTDLWPSTPIDSTGGGGGGNLKKAPRWKFWSRRSKKQKA